jgi:hypothetical protein
VKTRRADAPTHGRTGARRPATRWLRRAAALAVALCVGASVRLSAQEVVGVAPEHSPYHDITTHQSFAVFAGRWAGDVASAGVGARPGLALGARLEVRLSGPVALWATLGEATSSRRVLGITGSGATDTVRVVGTSKLNLILGDLALGLNLTGQKSWHHLAPYVGIGLGVVSATHAQTDTIGFKVGTAFAFAPTVGTRWFLSGDLAVRAEVRDYYYKYTYPLGYFDTPYAGPPPRASVLPTSMATSQWSNNFTLWIGVAYGFSF